MTTVAQLKRWKSIIMVVVMIGLLLPLSVTFFQRMDDGDCIRSVEAEHLLDLSRCEFDEQESFELRGDWQLFWRMMQSDVAALSSRERTGSGKTVRVPGSWHRMANADAGEFRKHGYATYRTDVLLPVEMIGQPLAVRMANVRLASRLFINGKWVAGSGIPGRELHSEIAKNAPYEALFVADKQQLVIELETSNHRFNSGGIHYPPLIGMQSNIAALSERYRLYDLFIIVVLIALALFFLSQMMLTNDRKLRRLYLYFILSFIGFAGYWYTMSEKLIYDIWPQLDYSLYFAVNTTFIVTGMQMLVWVLYASSSYAKRTVTNQRNMNRRLRFLSWFGGLYAGLAFVIPPEIFTGAIPILYGYMSILLIFVCRMLYTIIFRTPETNDYFYFAGFALLLNLFIYGLHFGWSVDMYIFPPIYLPLLVLALGLSLSKQQSLTERMLNRSELARLRHQIKPHFLYNALNTIIWLSSRDTAKTQQLLRKLSQFLRSAFTFEDQPELVSFAEERRVAEAYAAIEQARFAGQLEVEWSVACEDFRLPPYTLVTLLENAVTHGLRTRKQGGRIRVMVTELDDQHIQLEVNDNGPGFSREQLAKWQAEDYAAFPASGSGVGLQNVQVRLLRHLNSGLTLTRNEHGGASVSVTVPKGGMLR